jgi:hypothetical protein
MTKNTFNLRHFKENFAVARFIRTKCEKVHCGYEMKERCVGYGAHDIYSLHLQEITRKNFKKKNVEYSVT